MLQGHVYHKDSRQPIGGMLVSDGRNLCRTDASGYFSLPGWEHAHLVYVCALTHAHNDWFYMIENHEGDYDFYLSPVEAPGAHSFLHFSDTEIQKPCGEWLDFIKKYTRKLSPNFMIQTGDIYGKLGLEQHYLDMNESTMGCPVRYTLGNHDYVKENYGEYTFERLYGPTWYSFDLGPIHYVVLPITKGDAPSGYDPQDNYRWLKNDLSLADPAKKVIIFCHDLCLESEEDFILTIDGEPYDLKQKNLLAWVFGHLHTQYVSLANGVFNVGSANPAFAGVDSSPTAMRIIRISDDAQFSSEMIYNDLESDKSPDDAHWHTKLLGNILFSTPILEDGKLYVATADDGYPKKCAIYCLNPEDGSIVWETPSAHGVKNAMILRDGVLYALDAYGILLQLDAKSGAILSETPLKADTPRQISSAMFLEGDTLFVQAPHQSYAYSLCTREYLWESARDKTNALTPCPMISYQNLIIISKQWRALRAYDKISGELVWENKDMPWRNGVPVLDGDRIWLTHHNTLYCVSAATGETLLTHEYDANLVALGAPVFYQDHIFLPTISHGIIRVDQRTLEQTASFPVGKPMVAGSHYAYHTDHAAEATPLIADGQLIFLAGDGVLRFCDPETATVTRSLFVGAPSFVDLVRYGDTVITLDLAGNLRAYPLFA